MAVESVNNNRTAVVAGSFAVGAGAGAALGYANAKILEGNTPKDSFIRTLDNNILNHGKRMVNEKFDELKKLAETGNLAEVKNTEVKEAISATMRADKLDPEKATKEEVKEFIKKLDITDETRKAKLKTLEEESLSFIEKRARAFENIELPKKGGTLEEMQKILRDNHKLFGIEVKDGKIDEAVSTFTKEKYNNNVVRIKKAISDMKTGSSQDLKTAKENLHKVFGQFYDVSSKKFRELPKNASEQIKSGYRLVKKSINNFKLTAAAKWGALGAAALGLTSFVTAKITGKAADKAIAEAQEECECPECEDCEEA